jgi:catechol 2,3-dioxygenase-like lactoylglutathione lyase family enzyme
MFLEHVNLTVSDLKRSVAFYRELFGFQVRWEGTTADGQPAAHVGDERTYLALFQAETPGTAPEGYEHVGINHFGFVVDDLDATRARLVSLGVQPHYEPVYDPGRRLYFCDPDGIEIELVEYSPAGTVSAR